MAHGFPPANQGGTEICTYYLSKELAKKNEVHVFYPKILNSNKVLNSYEKENLHLHEYVLQDKLFNKFTRVYNSLFLENTYTNKSIEFVFKELIKKIKPDVIHFEHLFRLSINLIKIANNCGIPSIITLHDYWFICPNVRLLTNNFKICNGPDTRQCRNCWIKKKSMMSSETLINYKLPKFFTKFIIQLFLSSFNSNKDFKNRNKNLITLLLKTDKLIAPSKFLRKKFINYGIPENKIIYLENGYNLDVFQDFKKKKITEKIIFGFVGVINKHKGVDILVDAFLKIPEDKAILKIYGSYNPKSTYVQNILKKSRKKENIQFIGRFEEVKDPFSEIDVLVVPSIWNETGGPLVIREALIARIPVIATNLGSIPEIIQHGINGFLYNPNNKDELYTYLNKIISNPKLIDFFESNIRIPKSIEQQANELTIIYKEFCSNNKK